MNITSKTKKNLELEEQCAIDQFHLSSPKQLHTACNKGKYIAVKLMCGEKYSIHTSKFFTWIMDLQMKMLWKMRSTYVLNASNIYHFKVKKI